KTIGREVIKGNVRRSEMSSAIGKINSEAPHNKNARLPKKTCGARFPSTGGVRVFSRLKKPRGQAWLIFFGFKHLPFRTRSTNAKIKNAQAFKPARYPSLLLKTEPNNSAQTYSHTLLKTHRHDFIPLSILTAERIMPI